MDNTLFPYGFVNQQLAFDVEKLKTSENPQITKSFDDSQEFVNYILDVAEESYFYENENERDLDAILISKVLEIDSKLEIVKLQKFFEEQDFTVYLFEQDGKTCAEVESWTDGGVDMIITLMPFTKESFIEYVDDFDIDDEIDLHREGKMYCNHFTISESVVDFTTYHNKLKYVAKILEYGKEIDKIIEDSEKETNVNKMVSWIDQLIPIIEEYKDGGDNLTKTEVNDLVEIIKAKINLREGNISQETYDRILG